MFKMYFFLDWFREHYNDYAFLIILVILPTKWCIYYADSDLDFLFELW